MATNKKTSAKQTPAKRASAKKASAKKASAKKASAKKASAKKASAKKASAKKASAKKAPAKKASAKQAPVKKAPAKQAPAKKTGATAGSAREPATASTKSAASQPGALAIGEPAPAFSLPSDDGATWSLADLRGHRVVLYFYPRDSTPGCTVEACDFRDRHAALQAAGATVLGVSGDSLASHGRFRDKLALPFPLLADLGNATARAYGAWGHKVLYGKSREGVIRSTFLIGPDGRIERIWAPVRVAGHAQAVLDALG